MCGIVGYIGDKKAHEVLINGLKMLEYRGYDSAGIAVLEPKKGLEIIKNKGRVKNLEENVEKENLKGSIGIAHTRWATHGKPSKENAHPQIDNFGNFAVVHNGIIENYEEIKRKLEKEGYKLKTGTDTEVIPNLIDFYYKKENDEVKAVFKTLKDLEGSFAIEVISEKFPDKIIVAKKDSPMCIGKGKNENFVASDVPAILNYTKDFYFLEDGEMAEIYKDKINFYNFSGKTLKKINKDISNVKYDVNIADKEGYEDYMLKEIHEQPKAIRETIGTSLNEDKISLKELENIDFKKFNKIYFISCGTAMHAELVASYIFQRFCKMQVISEYSSEFRYNEPLIDKKTLCIFTSQSGETADTIAALKLAKKYKATTISIVNVIGSSITRLSDYTLYTHARPRNCSSFNKSIYLPSNTSCNFRIIYSRKIKFRKSRRNRRTKK